MQFNVLQNFIPIFVKSVNLIMRSTVKCLRLEIEGSLVIHNSIPGRVAQLVGNVSDYRCVSDCRSRGCEFVPGLVPYFCGD